MSNVHPHSASVSQMSCAHPGTGVSRAPHATSRTQLHWTHSVRGHAGCQTLPLAARAPRCCRESKANHAFIVSDLKINHAFACLSMILPLHQKKIMITQKKRPPEMPHLLQHQVVADALKLLVRPLLQHKHHVARLHVRVAAAGLAAQHHLGAVLVPLLNVHLEHLLLRHQPLPRPAAPRQAPRRAPPRRAGPAASARAGADARGEGRRAGAHKEAQQQPTRARAPPETTPLPWDSSMGVRACRHAGSLRRPTPRTSAGDGRPPAAHLAAAGGAQVLRRRRKAGLPAVAAGLLDLLHHAGTQGPHHDLHARAVALLRAHAPALSNAVGARGLWRTPSSALPCDGSARLHLRKMQRAH